MTHLKESVFNLYLKFFLIGCAVFYVPGQMAYVPQELFFKYGVMGMLGVCYFVPRKREISNFFLGAILIYAVLQTSVFKFYDGSAGILLNVFLGMFLIRELAERIDLDFKAIGNLLALFCAFNVLWITLQIYNIDPVFSSVAPDKKMAVDIVGWMGLKSNLGTLAALCFPFIFASNPFNALIVIPLLWFGYSSAAIASVVLTLLFILWFKSKKAFWISLFLVGAAGVFYVLKVDMPSGEFEKRFPVWFAGVRYLSGTHPILGDGLGSWANTRFTTIQDNGEPQTWSWAHNTFLQYMFELGVMGSIALYAYFKNMFSRIELYKRNHVLAISILIPLIITSFIHFPWHLGRFAALCCFMLASVEALITEKDFG